MSFLAGRNKKRVLNNDDEISLAFRNNRGVCVCVCLFHQTEFAVTTSVVFIFYDGSISTTASRPLPQVDRPHPPQPFELTSLSARLSKRNISCPSYWEG